MLWKGSGSLSGEKKVPDRKDMGMMTKLLKFDMSSWDFATMAAATAAAAKQNAVSAMTRKKAGDRSMRTPERRPTIMSRQAENRPRTVPVSVRPRAMDQGLTGETSTSSMVLV